MNRDQAHALIKHTFTQGFDKARFQNFAINLLNHLDESKTQTWKNQDIKKAFRNHVHCYEQFGTYTSPDKEKLDVLIVNLTNESKLDRARNAIRNFVADHLKTREEKDSALVAFVAPTGKQWRFSYVKMEYATVDKGSGTVGVETLLTPSRRFSYIVGEGESCHTAQTRFLNLLQETETNPRLADIENAFSVEAVTKEFFIKYRELFIRAKNELDKVIRDDPVVKSDFYKKGINNVDFSKKLLGQIIFLYFLQKKGWFGVQRDGQWGQGSKNFLRDIFEKKPCCYKNFFNDILEPLFYEALRNDRSHDDHYYSRFDCKIPFLNGGLFDPMNNYDWVKASILLPNELFSNNNRTKEGDTGDGIFDVFDRYNFTVAEDEPFEKEVAIDPELLGKAYEKFNAIRPDNFDAFLSTLKSSKKGEESKFNKQYGVYYTPREIVHHMCQKSLISYLATELNENVSRNSITTLIEHGASLQDFVARTEEKPLFSKEIIQHAMLIDEKLASIKVCDPAVGSGAFPVGMMTEIVRARNVLKMCINNNKTVYDFKRECIENALYGVDIDGGAVEIAKLRLWLSLIVDEDDIQNIKPLPNLDYKIVCGNSLLGFPENWDSPIGKEIEELIHEHFNETNPTNKERLKVQIDEKIESRYRNSLRNFGYQVDFDFKNVFSEVFQEKGGFDIVIANPPYVSNKKMHKNKMQDDILIYKKLFFSMKSGNVDIYVLFIEKSLSIIKNQGTIRLIIPNKFLIAKYSRSILDYVISKRQLTSIEDLSNVSVFESASVYPIIIELTKSENTKAIRQLFAVNNSRLQKLQEKVFDYKELTIDKLQSIKEEQPLIDKIIKQSTQLGNELDVSPGINGFQFANYGRCIFDKSEKNLKQMKYKKLVISGSIDKYVIKNNPIKYNKRRFVDPVIIFDSNIISPGKWALFESPKIVIAGMATKIEAYYDEKGELACGVNVYSIFESKILCFKYILAYLNTQLCSWLFRNLFYDKHLGGDYISINARLLKKLPIKLISHNYQEIFAELVDRILMAKKNNLQADTSKLEMEIDQLIYKLYGLTEREIKIVEGK